MPIESWALCIAMPICLRLLALWVRAAASRTFWTAGSSSPIRIAMIAITTNSSISVKAERLRRMGETSDDKWEKKTLWAKEGRQPNPRPGASPGRTGCFHPELRDPQPEVRGVRVEDHQEADPRGAELGGVFVGGEQHVGGPDLQPPPPATGRGE